MTDDQIHFDRRYGRGSLNSLRCATYPLEANKLSKVLPSLHTPQSGRLLDSAAVTSSVKTQAALAAVQIGRT
jgi:hypothetical protein